MAYWRLSDARAKFGNLLDAAEAEGPQLFRRGKQTFVVVTREDLDQRLEEVSKGKRKSVISGWDALRPSLGQSFDLEIPRRTGGVRKVDLS